MIASNIAVRRRHAFLISSFPAQLLLLVKVGEGASAAASASASATASASASAKILTRDKTPIFESFLNECMCLSDSGK